MTCTAPSPRLTSFRAAVEWGTVGDMRPLVVDEADEPSRGLLPNGSMRSVKMDSYNADAENLLLRGFIVRNTAWVIAVAVAVGPETKLMLNARRPPGKRSR